MQQTILYHLLPSIMNLSPPKWLSEFEWRHKATAMTAHWQRAYRRATRTRSSLFLVLPRWGLPVHAVFSANRRGRRRPRPRCDVSSESRDWIVQRRVFAQNLDPWCRVLHVHPLEPSKEDRSKTYLDRAGEMHPSKFVDYSTFKTAKIYFANGFRLRGLPSRLLPEPAYCEAPSLGQLGLVKFGSL